MSVHLFVKAGSHWVAQVSFVLVILLPQPPVLAWKVYTTMPDFFVPILFIVCDWSHHTFHGGLESPAPLWPVAVSVMKAHGMWTQAPDTRERTEFPSSLVTDNIPKSLLEEVKSVSMQSKCDIYQRAAGETARWSRALAALPGDLGLIPNTIWLLVPSRIQRLTAICNSRSMGSCALFWAMWAPGICAVYRQTRRYNIRTHKNKETNN